MSNETGLFSNIKVWPLKKEHRTLKANGSVIIANAVEVRFTVMHGKNGDFVRLPNRQQEKVNAETGIKQTEYYDQVRCLNKELSQQLNEIVLAEYQQVLNATPAENTPAEGKQYNDGIPF